MLAAPSAPAPSTAATTGPMQQADAASAAAIDAATTFIGRTRCSCALRVQRFDDRALGLRAAIRGLSFAERLLTALQIARQHIPEVLELRELRLKLPELR